MVPGPTAVVELAARLCLSHSLERVFHFNKAKSLQDVCAGQKALCSVSCSSFPRCPWFRVSWPAPEAYKCAISCSVCPADRLSMLLLDIGSMCDWCVYRSSFVYLFTSRCGDADLFSHERDKKEVKVIFIPTRQKTQVDLKLRLFCQTG